MPCVHGGEHIVQHWRRCGMFESNMNGLIPLSWRELQAYRELSGVIIDGWECEQVIEMSKAYVAFSRDADDINCIAPYSPELTEEQEQEIKAQTANNARNILRSKKKAS